MKPLEKDELYQNLHGFLKTKGVELKKGSYARTIHRACTLLSEAINLSQESLTRAKNQVDVKLDQMRQVIHEKTAPRANPAAAEPTAAPEPPPASDPAPKAAAPPAAGPSPKRKAARPRRPRPPRAGSA